jgi:hypothetical protein
MMKIFAGLASRLRSRLEECRSKKLPPWAPHLAALALRLLLAAVSEQRAQTESDEDPHHTQGQGPEQTHPEEREKEGRF